MVSSKNAKVSQKRCLGISIESFTGSSLSEQIISRKIKPSGFGIAGNLIFWNHNSVNFYSILNNEISKPKLISRLLDDYGLLNYFALRVDQFVSKLVYIFGTSGIKNH